MKKLYILFGVLLALILGSVATANIAAALSIHSGDNVRLTQERVINDSVYAAGRTVDINSEVYGDVYCAGQSVTISGTVHGDIMCAAQTITVNGRVEGDIRLAAQTIAVGAEVTGNATVAAQAFVLNSSGSIGGDLTGGATDLTLNGRVGRDVLAGGASVIVNSEVGRDIKAGADTMRLDAGARVGGNIELTSENRVVKDNQAIVSGTVKMISPEKAGAKIDNGALFGFSVLWFLYWFAAMLVISLVLVAVFPRLFQAVTDRAFPLPWMALLVGFLASVAMPMAIFMIAITIIGLPLALLVGFLWLGTLLLSGPLCAYYIGRLVLRGKSNAILYALAGSAILLVSYFLPFIGFLVMILASWLGTGMLLMQLQRVVPKPSYAMNNTAKKPKK